MTFFQKELSTTPFSSEHECIAYLFRKRWPHGFKCPFCHVQQTDTAPAHVVVCRYCRKQTSITAHTVMHGSKKSLISWMRVSSLFCLHHEGITARQLQRQMNLSCYQTAWSWLQKIRYGTAMAEKEPCRQIVLFDMTPLPAKPSYKNLVPDICMALEIRASNPLTSRLRLSTIISRTPKESTKVINESIDEKSTLLVKDQRWLSHECKIPSNSQGRPTDEQLNHGQQQLEEIVSWLTNVYRGAIDPSHLQGYLDEFCFRHNTAFWGDNLAVFDHLLTGLLTTVDKGQGEKP